MKKEMKELLQNTYKGNEIIEYIELLERENKALDEEGVAKCELNKRLEKALDKACSYTHNDGYSGCPKRYDCTTISEEKNKQCEMCDYEYIDIESEINNNDYAKKSKECWKEYFLNGK